MAANETPPITPYDEMMQTRQIQMLKTVVPYMNNSRQMQMAMFIQYLEFRHTYDMVRKGTPVLAACEIPEGTDRRSAMLNDLRQYCTPKEQETIDTLINLFCIMDNYEMFMS